MRNRNTDGIGQQFISGIKSAGRNIGGLVDLAVRNPKVALLSFSLLPFLPSCTTLKEMGSHIKDIHEEAIFKNMTYLEKQKFLLEKDRKAEEQEEKEIDRTIDDANNLLDQLKRYEYLNNGNSDFYSMFDKNIEKLNLLLNKLKELNTQEAEAIKIEDFNSALSIDNKADELRDTIMKTSIELHNGFILYLKQEQSGTVHRTSNESDG